VSDRFQEGLADERCDGSRRERGETGGELNPEIGVPAHAPGNLAREPLEVPPGDAGIGGPQHSVDDAQQEVGAAVLGEDLGEPILLRTHRDAGGGQPAADRRDRLLGESRDLGGEGMLAQVHAPSLAIHPEPSSYVSDGRSRLGT
jgi:hypothetical protein